MQLLTVLERNQLVFDTVHDEGWAFHVSNFVDVSKSVLDQITKPFVRLVGCDVSNRSVRGHKVQSSWASFARDVRCRSCSHAPSEDYNVGFLDAENLSNVVVNVKRVTCDVFLVGVEHELISGLMQIPWVELTFIRVILVEGAVADGGRLLTAVGATLFLLFTLSNIDEWIGIFRLAFVREIRVEILWRI